ncbi:hypothetical protein KO519_15210 [Paraglaciecola agarilytica]|uniref:HipA family kinase n=1 Tax=Paraglaciecola chathamensis TaxID=368405 RepID=UPI001C081EB4|nr:HipA family kinase [Paraglaciecola agarilytica]MBU3019036.1 hypothetical protein [Paraglaciecola agarilytica]
MKPQSDVSAEIGQLPTYSYQKNLFPIDIAVTYPNDQGTADLSVIGTGADGRDYAIKTIADGNGFVPITELFCYELARALSIATPEFQIVKLKTHELAFGSVWEGGAGITKTLPDMLKILKGELPVRNLKALLSKVYAFDLFVNNIDRHFGNFLFRTSYRENIGLAFDFGRSWYEISPYDFQALEPHNNTNKYHLYAKHFKRYDRELASNTLTEISKIEQDTILQILSMAPSEWLSTEDKDKFVNWWGSSDMIERINKLKGEL